jgi:aspartyl/asparaginyl-tRNA synthetase
MNFINIINEMNLETYLVQVIIKVDKSKKNTTEAYNQIRAIKNIVVVKVIKSEKMESLSDQNYDYAILDIKFLNESTPQKTLLDIKNNALKINGLVKFFLRDRTLNKIRNY